MDDAWATSIVASLNAIGGARRPAFELPALIRDWRPPGQQIAEPPGLDGFAACDTPLWVGRWVAQGRTWAAPVVPGVGRITDTSRLAARYKGMLSAHKTAHSVYATWEALMELYRAGSGLLPAAWAYWRILENQKLTVYQVFSAEVLLTPWCRAKFWEKAGSTFLARTRLYPKASKKLADAQRIALATGKYDLPAWNALAVLERVQALKIGLRVQQAWTSSNLALWLADGDELVDALRLKAVAIAQL